MIQFYSISTAIYLGAALAEIAGCFAFWAWLRQDKSAWWLIPGLLSLALFAYLLTRIDVSAAGRAYASYGGLYIATSLGWLWLAEGIRPNAWDVAGAGLAITGALVILVGTQVIR
ncbi:YnfA family protein [Salinisphaera sp. T31B1]|uniref:YnfA family protein n=1 Tax=Salinisphaera sp. T31B1 TaxID=727963 RepID=UPI00333E8BED